MLRPVLPPHGLVRARLGGAHAHRQRASLTLSLSLFLSTLGSRDPASWQKLNTIKRCLLEVAKQGGPFTARDLYPFQLALYQIDSLRKDGKFEGRDGSVPEGQGASTLFLRVCRRTLERSLTDCQEWCVCTAILCALLSEAHEIISMMQEEGVE